MSALPDQFSDVVPDRACGGCLDRTEPDRTAGTITGLNTALLGLHLPIYLGDFFMPRILPFRLSTLAPLACVALLGACSTNPHNTRHSVTPVPTTDAAVVGETRPGSGYLNGYLPASERPDSLALVLPPPQDGTPAKEADRAAYRTLTALRGTPRGDLAYRDAKLTFPQAAQTFSCALGVQVSEDMPHLIMLLRRTLVDAGAATYGAKNHYQRTRPFVEFGENSCTPEHEASLRKDGSYPSGHSALGWAWGLVLAEIAPERSNALVQRAHAFGQSRAICGVHWQSDVVAGREVAAAAVARLHADATFNAQLALAREEVRRGKAPNPAVCTAEAAALAQ